MNKFPSKETVNRIRELYPIGCRIKLISMNDPFSKLKSGDKGTVTHVDDIGTVFCRWDCGSCLGAVYREDIIKRI